MRYLRIAVAIMLCVFFISMFISKKNTEETFEDETKSVIDKLKETIDKILGREAVNDTDDDVTYDDEDALNGSL